jgi:hypothetical protein
MALKTAIHTAGEEDKVDKSVSLTRDFGLLPAIMSRGALLGRLVDRAEDTAVVYFVS